MSLKTYTPPFPLSESIAMMWHWEHYAPSHPQERILPIGLEEITFNLSDDVFCVHKASGYQYHRAMFVGCHSEHFVIDTSQPTTLFSVLFKPGGAKHFFDVSLKEHHNQIIDLKDVGGYSVESLYVQLMTATYAHERFQIMEQYLLQQRHDKVERHSAIAHAMDVFAVAPPNYKIAQVGKDIALSPPHFIQLFRDDIGITPKLFSRLQRFHRALDMIASQAVDSWADITYQCGFYDQSHMINEFQKFAGISPSAYTPQSPEHNKNLPYDDMS